MKKKNIWDIFIVSGGTFGHIRPALTLSDKMEEEGYSVLFFCTQKDKRFPLIRERKSENTRFFHIKGLPRKTYYFLRGLIFCVLLVSSIFKTGFYFLFQRPKVVVSSGGFVSFPLLFWARVLLIPYYLLEQNSVPGLVSRLFFKKAKKIFFAMDPVKDQYKKLPQALTIGNPIVIDKVSKQNALTFFNLPPSLIDKTVVGVIGGSLGAKALVEWAISQKDELDSLNITLFCITGQSFEQENQVSTSDSIIFVPFVKEITYFYALSDIIISRAGASTISELLAYNKPTIFVPYPFATENHQFYNAQFALKYLQGALIVQEDLSHYSLRDLLDKVKEDVADKKDPNNLSYALKKITRIIKESL